MTNKDYITIEGESFEVIKKTLQDWIDLYIDQLDKTNSFDILEKSKNNYLINVNGELSNLLFHFLVNYFRNPDKKGVKTRGYTNVKDSKQYPESELNKRVVVFVPDEDKQYDNVYVSTGSGKLYIIDFGFKRTEFNELVTFIEPELSQYKTSKEKIFVQKKTKSNKSKIEDGKKDLTKFLIPIFLFFLLINIFLLERNMFFHWSLMFLGFVLSYWIAEAHNKALLKTRNYFLFLGLSIIISSIGILYNDSLLKNIDQIFAISFFHSFFMLLTYQILRPVYKKIVKKEPIVDRFGSFSVGFYSILIIFIPAVISFILIENYLDFRDFRPK